MKVLITSDIHIDDYADYNFSNRSRLNQFLKLRDRTIELAKSHNCEEVWMLGDIINRANSRKYIDHVTKQFISGICSNVNKVRYILGQHDCESKSQNFNTDDTLITLFDFNNFIYMDKKILELDGHRYAFMNWYPEQDLDWIDGHVDALFGHYTKSSLFGQEIDESKFDLMIHGDIHNDQVLGKFVSVGNPIQHDMNSLPNGSMIVFDTSDNSYQRIRVDEDHTRFLRMSYVTDRELEGFQSELQYNVYKPNLDFTEESNEDNSLSWSSVDELVEEVCTSEGVLDIYEEVKSKCVPYSEIDFNFQLKYLKIHGVKSIQDLELDFDKGDKIALIGSNGSGKSTILTALEYAFRKNSELKYFQSEFTDDIWVKVGIYYQNKLYEITKGSKWGLTIDGSEQTYSGVREFDSDILTRLPFTNYLDLFFIKSGTQNLSMQFTSSRRIELIGKFYRLDRINAYWETSNILQSEVRDEISKLDDKYSELTVTGEVYNTRLEELKEYSYMDPELIKKSIDKMIKQSNDYQRWKEWESTEESLKKRLEGAKLDYESCNQEVDVDQLDKQIEELNESMEKYHQSYYKLLETSKSLDSDLSRLESLKTEGIELKSKYDNLQYNRCPLCNHEIDTDKVDNLRSEYEAKLVELRKSYVELKAKVDEYGENSIEVKTNVSTALEELKNKFSELKKNKKYLENQKELALVRNSRRSVIKDSYEKLKSEYEAHSKNKVEEVHLTLNYELELDKLYSDLKCTQEYGEWMSKLVSLNEQMESLAPKRLELVNRSERISKYSRLTHINGDIYAKILTKLADRFSSPEYMYTVDHGVYRGADYIEFNSFFMSKGKWRTYYQCSDGQRIMCDIDFLSKLFSMRVGLLSLDEYLKHLDDLNTPKAKDIILSIDANTLILSTHEAGMSDYTRRIFLELDSTGVTNCKVV